MILPDSAYRWTQWYVGREITQPWWLATPRNGDLFSPRITGVSEDEREARRGAHVLVTSEDLVLPLSSPIVFHYVDRVRGDVQRPLIVAPGVSITLDQAVTMARANGPFNQQLKTTLRSALGDSTPVTVALALPRGLSADSLSRTIVMAPGATRTLIFNLKGSLGRGTHEIKATASARGWRFAARAR